MDLFPETKTRAARSFTGWSLNAAISCDEAHPGFLRFCVTSSALRRQIIFGALALVSYEGAEAIAARLRPLIRHDRPPISDPLAVIATVLMTRRVRDISRALYGPVEGLVGVFGRLGDKPLHPVTYRTIVSLLSKPEHRARAKVLRQMQTVPASAPAVLLALKPPFLLPNLLECFRSVEEVTQFQSAIDLVQCVVPNVTQVELAKSIADLGPDAKLDDWCERWLHKSQRFPFVPPIRDDGEFVVLRSAKAMRDAAARFRNCLATKVGFCIVGRNAYVEYQPTPAIIELVGLSQGHWMLCGIYGPDNGAVDTDTAQAIHRKIQSAGILTPARVAHAKPYNAVARMMNIREFDGLELDVLEDDNELDALMEQVARDFEWA